MSKPYAFNTIPSLECCGAAKDRLQYNVFNGHLQCLECGQVYLIVQKEKIIISESKPVDEDEKEINLYDLLRDMDYLYEDEDKNKQEEDEDDAIK